MRRALLLVLMVICIAADSAKPLINAHAHNDYEHKRPLIDALEQGFCSVEADVFLVDGKLLVGHTQAQLRPDRTLEALYLEPLRERIQVNGGRIYAGGPTFTLLIDIKTDAEMTYAAVREALGRYERILTVCEDGKVREGAVMAIISGNRPRQTMAGERKRLALYDGRLEDLEGGAPAELIPLISSNWTATFSWRGQGQFPEEELRKLKELVARAHEQRRRIRFWGAPDNEPAWRVLHEARVDLINTDDLAGLSAFLRGAESKGAR